MATFAFSFGSGTLWTASSNPWTCPFTSTPSAVQLDVPAQFQGGGSTHLRTKRVIENDLGQLALGIAGRDATSADGLGVQLLDPRP